MVIRKDLKKNVSLMKKKPSDNMEEKNASPNISSRGALENSNLERLKNVSFMMNIIKRPSGTIERNGASAIISSKGS